MTAHQKIRWGRHLLIAALLGLASHAMAIWAFPRLAMRAVLAGAPAPEPGAAAYFPPPTDHHARRIVMPSPDLLYALCAIDLGAGPATVSADAKLGSYWSIALYADNTDNVFVLNDAQAAGRPVRLLLHRPGTAVPAYDGTVVAMPSSKALLLMRVLVDGSQPIERLDAARRTLRCDQAAR